MRYRCEYIYRCDPYPVHTWTAVGSLGACHLMIRDVCHTVGEEYGDRYTGGVEIHFRSPPDHAKNDPPTSDQCWLLKCPCWHDGSSTEVTDYWVPFWAGLMKGLRRYGVDEIHRRMFERLCDRTTCKLTGESYSGFGGIVAAVKETL